MPVLLTSAERVSNLLTMQTPNAQFTAAIDDLIGHVTALMEREMGRRVERVERTAYLSPRDSQRIFFLDAVPVTAVSSVREDADRAFGSETELDTTEWYARLGHPDSGRLEIEGLSDGTDTVRVVYTGGLGASLASIASDFPDLVSAATLQVANWWQRKDQLGGGSANSAGEVVVIYEGIDLLPEVRKACRRRKLGSAYAA